MLPSQIGVFNRSTFLLFPSFISYLWLNSPYSNYPLTPFQTSWYIQAACSGKASSNIYPGLNISLCYPGCNYILGNPVHIPTNVVLEKEGWYLIVLSASNGIESTVVTASINVSVVASVSSVCKERRRRGAEIWGVGTREMSTSRN